MEENKIRIVDKERDYYDVGQGLGYDNSVTYYRTRKTIEFNESYDKNIFIGFCGTVYPCLFLGTYYGAKSHGQEHPYVYDIADLDRWVEEHYSETDLNYYNGILQKGKCPCFSATSRKRAIAFLSNKNRGHLYQKYFEEHNAPIFAVDTQYKYGKTTLIINPLLRPYQFQKVKDPYTAYQEIEQYVGGVLLSPAPPVPVPSDEIMVEIKGFDPKWGFRKPPKEKP